MKIVNSEDIRNLEKILEEQYKIPTLMLMENASIFIFNFLKENIPDLKDKNVAVLCGPGNNGGDGVALVRHLLNYGVKNIFVFSYLWDKKISDLLKIQLTLLNDVSILDLKSNYKDLRLFDVIVDGIFGIGLKREIEDDLKNIFEYINELKKIVVSIDVPSGIDSDTGEIRGSAIKSSYTLTMFYPKKGFFEYPAMEFIGNLVVGRLNFGEAFLDSLVKSNVELVDENMVQELIPVHTKMAHKGRKGKVLIIGGSFKYTGAPVLSALSALRSGAGMVYLAIPESIHMIYRAIYPEIIYIPLKQIDGYISSENMDYIVDIINSYGIDSIGLGPGIGLHSDTKLFVKEIIKKLDIPMVVDADALSYIRDILEEIKGKKIIITPHYGEMSKILNLPIDYIQKNRFLIGEDFVRKYKINLILKGPYSLTFTKEGQIYVNPFADSLLATAGSGDVLTGILASLLAQGLSESNACILGNYIHGFSVNIWKRNRGNYGMISSDIIDFLPDIFMEILKRKSI